MRGIQDVHNRRRDGLLTCQLVSGRPETNMRKIVRRGRGMLGRSGGPGKFSLRRGPRANWTVSRSPLKSLPSVYRSVNQVRQSSASITYGMLDGDCQPDDPVRSQGRAAQGYLTRNHISSIHRILVLDKPESVHQLDLCDLPGAMATKVFLDVLFSHLKKATTTPTRAPSAKVS